MIESSEWPGTMEYFKFPLARPAATGFLYIPSFSRFSSIKFKYNPVVSADPPGI